MTEAVKEAIHVEDQEADQEAQSNPPERGMEFLTKGKRLYCSHEDRRESPRSDRSEERRERRRSPSSPARSVSSSLYNHACPIGITFRRTPRKEGK